MKREKINYAFDKDTYTVGTIHYTSIGYDLSDELFEYLRMIGKNVIGLYYGYYNGYDVIAWRD